MSADLLRRAATKLRDSQDLPPVAGEIEERSIPTLNFIVDLLRAREPLADLLDEIADQYDGPTCDGSPGVCNNCGCRVDFVLAPAVADILLREVTDA